MKKWAKILLGVATLWPILYMFIFFMFIFSMVLFMPNQSPGEGPPTWFFIIFPLHILTILWIFGLTIFYILNIFKNDRVDQDKKVLWAVVIFFGSMFAMPVYWYLYIWREAAVDGSRGPSTLASANAPGYLNEVKAPNREHQYVPPAQPPNWRE